MNTRQSLFAGTGIMRVLTILIVFTLFAASNAWAQVVFTVNSTLDQVDAQLNDSLCATTAGTCTLRAAVMQANQMGNAGAFIVLPAGTYTLTIGSLSADGDSNGDLNLTTPASGNPIITISGSGATTTIIDANNIDRIFDVAASRTAVVSGVTLRYGLVVLANGGAIANRGNLTLAHSLISRNSAESDDSHTSYGGGIYNAGTLALSDVTLDGNAADVGAGIFGDSAGVTTIDSTTITANDAASNGGAIANRGVLNIDRSVLSNNHAFSGGGIFQDASGSLLVDRSTLSGNDAIQGGSLYGDGQIHRSTLSGNTAIDGGGAYSINSNLYISNSTLSANTATQNGGAIFVGSNVLIFNSTIVFNQADADSDSNGQGAGIYNPFGTTEIRNSILAGNIIPGDNAYYDDCWGALNAYGSNSFSATTGGIFSNCHPAQVGPGNPLGLDTYDGLGPLQDNGGLTPTHALVPPSDMIDGTDAAVDCVDEHGLPLTTDQRGMPRVVGARCDIGAFEYSDAIFTNGFDD